MVFIVGSKPFNLLDTKDPKGTEQSVGKYLDIGISPGERQGYEAAGRASVLTS